MSPIIFVFFTFGLFLPANSQRRPRGQPFIASPNSISCTTPNGDSGSCSYIRHCPTLSKLLRSSINKSEVDAFLIRSVCSYDSYSNPLVCCPYDKTFHLRATIERSKEQKPPKPIDYGCGHFPNVTEFGKGGSAWPWLAALGYRSDPRNKLQFLCSAALVTDRHLVTAAHCVDPPNAKMYAVRIGDVDLKKTIDAASSMEIKILKWVTHPESDIAVVQLKQPISQMNKIRPICLPGVNDKPDSSHLVTAGWGISHSGQLKLVESQVVLYNNTLCQTYYSQAAKFAQGQLCAGASAGEDSCKWDSGGPLMEQKLGLYYLTGVLSFGYKCTDPSSPSVFVRTASFLDWINQNIT